MNKETDKHLDVRHRSLRTLSYFPLDVEYLNCSYNFLEVLPELPKDLKELYCYSNVLTSLPELPDNLTYLICFDNKLKELPKIPSKIIKLNCANNKIKHLPELPENLIDLFCYNNPLECLIPIQYIDEQHKLWLYDYYLPYLRSYEGQKNILTNYPTKYTELLKYCGILPHNSVNLRYAKPIVLLDEIKDEFSYLINSYDLNLL